MLGRGGEGTLRLGLGLEPGVTRSIFTRRTQEIVWKKQTHKYRENETWPENFRAAYMCARSNSQMKRRRRDACGGSPFCSSRCRVVMVPPIFLSRFAMMGWIEEGDDRRRVVDAKKERVSRDSTIHPALLTHPPPFSLLPSHLPRKNTKNVSKARDDEGG
jgi:hypothetical protein